MLLKEFNEQIHIKHPEHCLAHRNDQPLGVVISKIIGSTCVFSRSLLGKHEIKDPGQRGVDSNSIKFNF